MKKPFLLVIGFCLTALLFCNMVSAQSPSGVFAKATEAPQIDGYGTATVKQDDNVPYIIGLISNISVPNGSANQVIDLTAIFKSNDLINVMTYTYSNSNDQVVQCVIVGSTLTLTFSALNQGTANMIVTAIVNRKEVSSYFTVEVTWPTGIRPIANEATFQVYPNPTNGKLKLKFSQTPKAGTVITVYNYSGQVVLQTVTGDRFVNLDLSGNAAGLYFIKVGQKTFKGVFHESPNFYGSCFQLVL